jgi:hypothetical protein
MTMTETDDVSLLRQGKTAWGAWSQANPSIQPDLHEVNLNGANLFGSPASRCRSSITFCASATAGALLPRPNSSPARFTSSCFQLLIGYAIAVDAGGNAYVTGYTASSTFPTTAAAFQPAPANGANAIVTKFSLKPPVCCGDFNGDGRADILWRNASGEVYVWLMNGTNLIGAGSPGSVSSDWQIE